MNRRNPWGALVLAATLALPAIAAIPSEVQEKVHAAESAYSAERFQESLRLFSEAYALDPLPGILFDIAQCQRRLGNWDRAAVFYRRYLSESPSRPKNAAEAEDLLREVEGKRQAELKKRQRAQAQAQRPAPPAPVAEPRVIAEDAPKEVAAPPPPLLNAEPVPPPTVTALPPPALPAATPAGEVSPESPSRPTESSVLRKWWFWTGVGVVVAGVATATWVAAEPQAKPGSLGIINAR